MQALLGADWTGIVGSDRNSAYRYLPLDRRQLCRAHLIREFRTIAAYNPHQRPFGERDARDREGVGAVDQLPRPRTLLRRIEREVADHHAGIPQGRHTSPRSGRRGR